MHVDERCAPRAHHFIPSLYLLMLILLSHTFLFSVDSGHGGQTPDLDGMKWMGLTKVCGIHFFLLRSYVDDPKILAHLTGHDVMPFPSL